MHVPFPDLLLGYSSTILCEDLCCKLQEAIKLKKEVSLK